MTNRAASLGKAARPTPVGAMHVLLVDDEEPLIRHVRRILEHAGFVVHLARSARAGFDRALGGPLDVVLIDKSLPDLDGIELLRRMRRSDALGTVPIIMLSGRADETTVTTALGEGADDFVLKPFNARDLVARIEANVRLVRLRRAVTWREGELAQLKQSQKELRSLLKVVERVRDEERRMLAREVHDQLGQLLTAAKLEIRLLQKRLVEQAQSMPAERVVAALDTALATIDRATAAVQDISAQLRPPELEEAGLVAALRWQAADLQARTGIEFEVRHDPANYVEQPPAVAAELLRICQEAMTNVLRHARASRAVVQVVMRNACLLIRICDDGVSIPRARLHDPASLGLKGMRERGARIQASVHVYGRRGRGTMVAVRRRLAFV